MIFRPHPVRATTLHRLRRHQALLLRRPQGLCVRAERGSLWLTVDGELADIQLSPGESRRFENPSTVVVATVGGDAVASIARKDMPAWTQRLKAWMRSLLKRLPA